MITDVESGDLVRTSFVPERNYPNPFNPSTTIKFELPRTSHVNLSMYDFLGREVSVLVNERGEAGVHEVKFDGSNLASGVYVSRLRAGDVVQSKTLVLLKWRGRHRHRSLSAPDSTPREQTSELILGSRFEGQVRAGKMEYWFQPC